MHGFGESALMSQWFTDYLSCNKIEGISVHNAGLDNIDLKKDNYNAGENYFVRESDLLVLLCGEPEWLQKYKPKGQILTKYEIRKKTQTSDAEDMFKFLVDKLFDKEMDPESG